MIHEKQENNNSQILEQKNKKSQFNCNQIMLEVSPKKNVDYSINLPAYLRIKLKGLKAMSFEDLNAEINLSIILTVKVKGLPENIKNHLRSNIVLQFRRNKAKQLVEDDLSVTFHQKNGYYQFVFRSFLRARMQPYIVLSPLQVVDLISTIRVKKLVMYIGDTRKMQIRINVMDQNLGKNQKQQIINYTNDNSYANYDLAENRLVTEFTDRSNPKTLLQLGKNLYSCKIWDQSKPKIKDQTRKGAPHVEYAHFHIPVYRSPTLMLTSIFIPLWVLGIINLAIFFQPVQLITRVTNVATLLIAFVAFIPIIRDQVPANPHVTIIQVLAYLQTSTTFLCLIQSLILAVRKQQLNVYGNALYYISLIIVLLAIAGPSLALLVHFFYLQKQHNSEVKKSFKISSRWQEWGQRQQINNKFQEYYKQNRDRFFCESDQQYKDTLDKIGENRIHSYKELMGQAAMLIIY